MSHTVKVKTNLSDVDKLRTACAALGYGLKLDVERVKLFQGSIENAHEVSIPGWRYPVAVKGTEIFFDNYNGAWGDPKLLKRLENRYGMLLVEERAKARGESTRWTTDEQGRTQLEIIKPY